MVIEHSWSVFCRLMPVLMPVLMLVLMPVLMMVKHDDSETARVGNNVWVVNCVDVL